MTAPRAYVDWILKRLDRAALLALRNDHPDPLIALAIEDEICMRRAARNRESGDSISEAMKAGDPLIGDLRDAREAQPPVLNKSGDPLGRDLTPAQAVERIKAVGCMCKAEPSAPGPTVRGPHHVPGCLMWLGECECMDGRHMERAARGDVCACRCHPNNRPDVNKSGGSDEYAPERRVHEHFGPCGIESSCDRCGAAAGEPCDLTKPCHQHGGPESPF